MLWTYGKNKLGEAYLAGGMHVKRREDKKRGRPVWRWKTGMKDALSGWGLNMHKGVKHA